MKKYLVCFIVLLCVMGFSLSVYGSETESFITESLEDWNDELKDFIPAEAENLLNDLNLRDMDLEQILSLEPERFISLFQQELSYQWKEPFMAFGKIMGILLISALLNPLQDSLLKGQSAEPFHFASMLCLTTILAKPATECIQSAMNALEHCSLFLLALIPILCAVLMLGGHAISASAYQFLLFGACQLVSQLAVNMAVPLLGMYFALSMIFSLFPNMGFQGITGAMKNMICWGLGIVSTIFVALLSLQTFISSNVDVVTLKASRFLMGSFIPVVGNILSEAFAAAQGCVSLLKSTIGTFAIVVSVCTMIPILMRTVLWHLILWLSIQLSQLLELKSLASLLRCAGNTFSIILALLSCFLLLMLIAISVLIFIGTGG